VTSLAAVTGRFQPFHVAHLELVQIALASFDRVVIGITNPDPQSRREHPDSGHRHLAAANPFTYYQRYRMIGAAIDRAGVQQRVDIVAFPLETPEVWEHYIPLTAVQFVRVYTPWEVAKVDRLRAGGYRVEEVAHEIAQPLRSTDIRKALGIAIGAPTANTDDMQWRELVPPGVAEVLAP